MTAKNTYEEAIRGTAREAVEMERTYGGGYAYLIGTIRAISGGDDAPSNEVRKILLLLEEFDQAQRE